MSRTRVAIAGFQHETNTFAPLPTSYEDFLTGGSWPGLTTGEGVIDVFRDLNIPIGGFIQAATDWQLVPVLWTSAEPAGYVSRAAFDTVMTALCDGLKSAGRLDAVYLDLHGAMVVDGYEDGEGEVLRRVREVVGDDTPIAVSLDLHGNLYAEFFDACDVVTIYRTYPHIDMAETGRRANVLLRQRLQHGKPLAKAFRQLAYLIPLTSQSTMREPAGTLYRQLENLTDPVMLSADIALGFPAADIQHTGASLLCYGTEQTACNRYASELLDELNRLEGAFANPLLSASQAVEKAQQIAQIASKPVIICDPQDNPGAGASGDTTGLLHALIAAGARDAWLGLLWDPAAAAMAHGAGEGAVFNVSLGGRYADELPQNAPVTGPVFVEALADGEFLFTGPMYGGATAQLGKMALLKIDREDCDVHIVVSSVRTQNADCEIYRCVGIEPSEKSILVIKSSVHFLADYEPIAQEIIFAKADGMNLCDLQDIDYKNLRSGVRLGPHGPVFQRAREASY